MSKKPPTLSASDTQQEEKPDTVTELICFNLAYVELNVCCSLIGLFQLYLDLLNFSNT